MGQFKIGIIADGLKLPFEQSMEACARMGADGVQLYAVEGEMAPEALTAEIVAKKRRILRDNGLCVSALCGDLGGHGFLIQAENASKIEKSRRIIDAALEMGTNVVTTHIGVVPEDSGSDRYKVLQEACNQLAAYACENKAWFAIETGPEPAERLAAFLKSLDSKGVAVNLDPANLVMVCGDDPAKAVYTLKDYIVHTHAKDGKMLNYVGGEEVYGYFASGGIGDLRLEECFLETPLGQGDVDFDAYLSALRDIGYDGYLTIEREVGENPAADIDMAIQFLKNHPRF